MAESVARLSGQASRVRPFDAGPVLETTSAGDAFNGTLAVALSQGLPRRSRPSRLCHLRYLRHPRLGHSPSHPDPS